MIPLFPLIFLLSLTWASPAPPILLSIFNDNSINTANQPGSGLLNFTPHPGSTLKKRASNLPYVLYDVTFDGRNGVNWQPFQVSGKLLLVQGVPSANGVNLYDVAISIGNPIGNPMAGSIRYVTNRYLNPYISDSRDNTGLGYARVSTTADSVTVSVDTSLAGANQISVFNA